MKYEGVSDDQVEKIARDVRSWDASRTPEARQANTLEGQRQSVADWFDTWKNYNQRNEHRQQQTLELDELRTAVEVLTLSLNSGIASAANEIVAFRQSVHVRALLAKYGIPFDIEGS